MRERELATVRRTQRHRDLLLAGLCRDLAMQNRWLKARLIELGQRVRALDNEPPPRVPPWPLIDVPPELRGLLPEDD